jgi:hypothetical protein
MSQDGRFIPCEQRVAELREKHLTIAGDRRTFDLINERKEPRKVQRNCQELSGR